MNLQSVNWRVDHNGRHECAYFGADAGGSDDPSSGSGGCPSEL